MFYRIIILLFVCDIAIADPVTFDQLQKRSNVIKDLSFLNSQESNKSCDEVNDFIKKLKVFDDLKINSKKNFLEQLFEDAKEESLKMISDDFKSSASMYMPAYSTHPNVQLRIKVGPFLYSNLIAYLAVKGHTLQNLPSDEVIENYAKELYGFDFYKTEDMNDSRIKEGVTIIRFLQMTATGNGKKALDYLSTRTSNFSTPQKVSLLSSLLENLNLNYDFKIIKDLFKDVSDKKMAQMAVRDFLGVGYGEAYNAGICRHMHQFALKAARSMGLGLSYGVSFPTANGYHSTLIITNPDNPTETIRFNYNYVTKINGEQGQVVLDQSLSSRSSGITFHLWGEHDNPVYFSPSEKGLVLEKVSGGDVENFDPLTQSRSMLRTTQVENATTTIRFFEANIPEGKESKMFGASIVKDVKYNDLFKARYGLSLYRSEKTEHPWEYSIHNSNYFSNDDKLTTTGLFFYLDNEFKINLFHKNGIKLDLKSNLILRGTPYYSEIVSRTKTSFNVAGRGTYKASSNQNERVLLGDGSGQWITRFSLGYDDKVTTSIETDISGQTQDIRTTSGFDFYLRRTTTRINFNLGRYGDYSIFQKNIFNYIPLDNNDVWIGGHEVISKGGGAILKIGVIYPISKLAPAFLMGSRKTYELSAGINFFDDKVQLSLGAFLAPSLFFYFDDTANEVFMDQKSFIDLENKENNAPKKVKGQNKVPSDYGGGVKLELSF